MCILCAFSSFLRAQEFPKVHNGIYVHNSMHLPDPRFLTELPIPRGKVHGQYILHYANDFKKCTIVFKCIIVFIIMTLDFDGTPDSWRVSAWAMHFALCKEFSKVPNSI